MTSKEKTKSLVNKASTDDRNPPSGYLLKELSSRTMSIQECQTIEDLVIKKLAKNKPYIKYKALRIVKYLCENGSPNWRRAWQRNTDKLRDAQQFRGPPDPIYGDAPYQQVRKAAKDAMQAVFQQSQINSSNIASRIKGVDGGSAYGGYSGSGSSFGSGSKGVYGGSSLSKSKKAPSAPSWDKKVMDGHGTGNYKPTARTTTFEPLKSSGGYSNPAVLAGTNVHSRGKLDTRKASKGKRKKGKAGGVWGGDDAEDAVESEEEDYQTYDDFPASTSYEKPRKKAFGGNIKKKSKSSGQYEKRWVDDIVKSGGVGCKILDLPKYVQQFENLSKNHVLEYLDEKLEDSAWQKQGKALALIEALIKGKSSDDVIDYFNQSPENIQACQNAKKSILRRKANAIVEYLDIDEDDDDDDDDEEDEDEEEEQTQKRQQIQTSTNDDLLNLGGGNDEEEEEDMFADMNTEEKPKQEPQEDLLGNSMFDNMNQPPQQTQPTTTATDDIMGLMGDVVSTQENLQQAQEQQRKKEKFAFLDNLAADAGVNQQNNSGDILGFGSNTNNAQTQSSQPSGASIGGGSAFGFDLSGSGNQQSQVQPVQTQATSGAGVSGSAFGFDLSGSGASTQQQQVPQQSTATATATTTATTGGSAFGFDLSGSSASTQQQTNQPTQSMNSMNRMGMMGNQQTMNNPMMTQNMLQQNMQNMAQMNQMMNQMQQMQMNPNMMNMMQQNMMNQGMMQQNMMQQNMMQSGGSMMGGMGNNPQSGNSFLQAMQNVNNPSQPQKPQQAYVNHQDPFAQVMANASNPSQGSNAPTRAVPKKTGPDPFAEFGLKSMQ